MANPYTAIAGAIVGGLLGGITSYNQAKKRAAASKQAASMLKEAANKYTGENADASMRQEGIQRSILTGNRNQTNVAPNLSNQKTAQAQAAASLDNIANENKNATGFKSGAETRALKNKGQMAATNQQVQNMLKQAGVDYDVAQAQTQGAFNGAAGIMDTVNQITSDETAKEDDRLFEAIDKFKTLTQELRELKGEDNY